MKFPLFGIGHSNRSLEFFVGLLLGYEINHLVDVRLLPGSTFNPQFNGDSLRANLKAINIAYTHLPGLGGRRRPRLDSKNTGWKNASF